MKFYKKNLSLKQKELDQNPIPNLKRLKRENPLGKKNSVKRFIK